MSYENMPIVTLKSGLVVGNFSSPHTFTFDDGSVLESNSKEQASALSINFIETEQPTPDERYKNVSLTFGLPVKVKTLMVSCMLNWAHGDLDIVLVPLPMLKELQRQEYEAGPFRSIRRTNRFDNIICSDRFSI